IVAAIGDTALPGFLSDRLAGWKAGVEIVVDRRVEIRALVLRSPQGHGRDIWTWKQVLPELRVSDRGTEQGVGGEVDVRIGIAGEVEQMAVLVVAPAGCAHQEGGSGIMR